MSSNGRRQSGRAAWRPHPVRSTNHRATGPGDRPSARLAARPRTHQSPNSFSPSSGRCAATTSTTPDPQTAAEPAPDWIVRPVTGPTTAARARSNPRPWAARRRMRLVERLPYRGRCFEAASRHSSALPSARSRRAKERPTACSPVRNRAIKATGMPARPRSWTQPPRKSRPPRRATPESDESDSSSDHSAGQAAEPPRPTETFADECRCYGSTRNGDGEWCCPRPGRSSGDVRFQPRVEVGCPNAGAVRDKHPPLTLAD